MSPDVAWPSRERRERSGRRSFGDRRQRPERRVDERRMQSMLVPVDRRAADRRTGRDRRTARERRGMSERRAAAASATGG